MHQLEITSLNDLAQIPDEELLGCLGALHAAIIEAKRCHTVLKRDGLIAPDAPFKFQSFAWHPKRSQRLDAIGRISPETPIEEIPIRPSAREALRALNILCVEDLSAISEEELFDEAAIGKKTLARLREILARVDLDFLPSPDEEIRRREQSKAMLTRLRSCG